MVFPMESEERVKRRALEVCRDHLRKIVEVTRKVQQMVDCFVNEETDAAKQLLMEIRKSVEEVDAARRTVARELVEIGAILMSREDFLRFTNLASEIADFCEGIAFRLFEIMDRKWKVPLELREGVSKLSEAVLETVLKLRETAMTLNYGSTKTLEKAQEVELAEHIVDDLYRELEIKIISSKMDIPVMILLRDIIQLLEDAADKAEDAADAARIITFAM